ncbi:hypothetical protein [Polyangium fumosum]|uniref:Uncharacterized protein n=1 Tax=Polyangium fumosum TaxID=889272 RepID=A0A4U1JCV3_9BACT|nr:hypothetical protein [Polyangium fumosum]TKD08515.1 hypothetical protein E8A74_14565 [Polyangium fumosum]
MSVSIYSNAFNFGSYLSGAVDPRTGQYSVAIPFVQIRPPNLDDLSRSIGITFSALRLENRGFGIGWSMSLCSLDLTNNQNVLTLSDGRSFQGNSLPPDGYDLTFKDQKLKDFRVTKIDANTFDVISKDGVVERLVKGGGRAHRPALAPALPQRRDLSIFL